MIQELTLLNLSPQNPDAEALEKAVHPHRREVFILKTCQRFLLLGFNQIPLSLVQPKTKKLHLEGINAYQFLLETICGLKSKILGENEIAHQFKKAYRELTETSSPNPHLLNILEKLFKDAKQIRREHLLKIGLPTYAGIVRKMIANQLTNGPVVIAGSGVLAEDLIKIMYKKYQLHLFARNQQRAKQLRDQYQINILSWKDINSLASYPVIVNTIGSKKEIFNQLFIEAWEKKNLSHKLMICLGEPSPVASHLNKRNSILKLNDIFREGQIQKDSTHQKILMAKAAISKLSHTRHSNFSIHFPFGFEELQFA